MVLVEDKVLGLVGNLIITRVRGQKVAVLLTKKDKIILKDVLLIEDLFAGEGSNFKCVVRKVGISKVLVLLKCIYLCGLDYSSAETKINIMARLWFIEFASEPLKDANIALALPGMYIEHTLKAEVRKDAILANLYISQGDGPDSYLIHTADGSRTPALIPTLRLSKKLRMQFEGLKRENRILYECKLHTEFQKWVPLKAHLTS